MMVKLQSLTYCALVLGPLAVASCVAVEYEIVDLIPDGSENSAASAINDVGQVVGSSWWDSGPFHALHGAMGSSNISALSMSLAMNDLKGLINQVEAQKIALGTAAEIIQQANAAIGVLSA